MNMATSQMSSSCSSLPGRHPSFHFKFSSCASKKRTHIVIPSNPKTSTLNGPISTISTCTTLRSSSADSVATTDVEVNQMFAIKKRASEISTDLKGTSVFLVGMPSSYKSSLGKILADSLRYYFFDSDSLVEEAAGGKMAALSDIGKDEEGYNISETEVLKQLSSMGRLVVSAGNGAVKTSTNLALLRHGISIWIDVPLDMVAREITEDRIQLSASDLSLCNSSTEVSAQLIKLYDSAQSGYSAADVKISTQKVASELGYEDPNEVTPEDLCMEVFKEIEKMVRVKKMMEEAARPF